MERSRELRRLSYYRHAEKRRAYSAAYYQEHREEILTGYSVGGTRPPRKVTPEKRRAQNLLNQAIARGEIEPQSCEGCRKVAYETRDGRRGIHAHHDDYSKPFEVRWLCYACHGKEHRKL